jgi:hypothetical protein
MTGAKYAALPKIATPSRTIVHFCQNDILIASGLNPQSPLQHRDATHRWICRSTFAVTVSLGQPA